MGRPPSNGGPAFRFMANEVAEMDAILQEHQNNMPVKEVLVALAEKFSESPDRKGKIVVQMKQVWNWFQNRRYAIRSKSSKPPVKLNVTPMPRDDSAPVKSVPQTIAASIPAPVSITGPASSGGTILEHPYMEFEAKSARDGAWYDVASFLAHKLPDSGDAEVLVRFSGFGPDEDEWVNVFKHVRQRSLPCEASECAVVIPGDSILCFQEGKDQALYFDAQVLDAQRRRHDVRGCRCRFLVRYEHDQTEEIVPLRKICRRPETDYRLQQLHAANESAVTYHHKPSTDPSRNTRKVTFPTTQTQQKQHNSYVAMTNPSIPPNVLPTVKTTTMEPKASEPVIATNTGNPSDFANPASNSGPVNSSHNIGATSTASVISGENTEEGK
ncbi:hypothetical protein K2173_011922 [Erythroxylum novogranatense]|uniref:Homeobox domain-containing protein n=1 Tax=Erythroxylum novogranatense TaxID=1862640 RepID=A0AAV8TEM8_9ROSI|nr:hypothetical protein K2173_011922 [Erythroxylum novogranatense]